MPRVIHFEIQADNPERAVTFYEKIFGWTFNKWAGPMDYWLITTGPDSQPGINGGLMKRMAAQNMDSMNAYVCTIDVSNLDESVKQVLSAGGSMAMPKQAVPGVGWLAYCKDTENNIFGMMQSDPHAKLPA